MTWKKLKLYLDFRHGQNIFYLLDVFNYIDTYNPTQKNIGTNDKFYRKAAFLMYTEMVNFRPQSLKAASKLKPHRGLGTRLPPS